MRSRLVQERPTQLLECFQQGCDRRGHIDDVVVTRSLIVRCVCVCVCCWDESVKTQGSTESDNAQCPPDVRGLQTTTPERSISTIGKTHCGESGTCISAGKNQCGYSPIDVEDDF